MARSLSGAVVAVTGGGRGIGAATGAALARAGVKVAIGDIDLAAAEQTTRTIGSGALALQLDVGESRGFTEFLGHAMGGASQFHALWVVGSAKPGKDRA